MSEGSLGAPTRHTIAWQDPDFTDPEQLDAEMRRVFDICHGCRRCFNLCDSFPRLFDLIDSTPGEELSEVPTSAFKGVVDACTLCDMCFMTKCPYVPPHEFDLDFPHLMLRYRVAEFQGGDHGGLRAELSKTDRNGKLAHLVPALANWASSRDNALTRPILEKVAGVHRDAALPLYHGTTFEDLPAPAVATDAPAARRPTGARKAVLYATCFVNYNSPEIGTAARTVLAKNGVETEVVYPECCGMPQLESGDIATVASKARNVAAALVPWIDKGYDIIALVPSCALMLKFEWPLIEPTNANVKRLADATYDIAEYVVEIAGEEGLAPGLQPLDGDVSIHLACHARAQNMGPKGAQMLRLIPDTKVGVVERCSGHGGSWGVMKENFEIAIKVGRPVARQAKESGAQYVVSECPLAREHILQGMERLAGADDKPAITPNPEVKHPIQIIAKAYGIDSLKKKTEIARSDILELAAYDKIRGQRRQEIAAIKKPRRVSVGPHATFHFESYETMLYQIQEMMRAERGGDAQLTEELAAYNPLVPKGRDLTATVMFEIDDPIARGRFLSSIGDVEKHFVMEIAGEAVAVRPEEDLERTNEAGKTSSIHFIHFDFTPTQIAKVKTPGTRIMVGVDHPNYGHVAILSEETRAALSDDLGD